MIQHSTRNNSLNEQLMVEDGSLMLTDHELNTSVNLVELEDVESKNRNDRDTILSFKCSDDSFRTHKRDKLEVHCKKSYDTITELDLHVRVHDPPQKIMCKECDEAFPDSKQLDRHNSKSHKPMKTLIACPLCEVHFSNENDLKLHKSMHMSSDQTDTNGEKPCNVPSKVTEPQDVISSNVSDTNTGECSLSCHICTKVFNSMGDLAHHYENDHVHNSTVECSICNFVGLGRDDLWFLSQITRLPYSSQ